jgi:hypothetical protein
MMIAFPDERLLERMIENIGAANAEIKRAADRIRLFQLPLERMVKRGCGSVAGSLAMLPCAYFSFVASIAAFAPKPTVTGKDTWWPRVVMLSSCTAKEKL